MRKNQNISNFHYRSELTDENGETQTKYYYTLQDICDQYETSTFTIYRMMKGYEPKSLNLKNIKFFKDYKPAYVLVKNMDLV